MPSPTISRVIAAPVLLAGGAFSLPLAALALDRGEGTENWILPGQLAGMAVVGAGLGAALPQIAGREASHLHGARVGVAAALGAAVLGDVALFMMVTG